ncbi:hypothetical protein [Rhodococcus tukisamuensis]|uniref:Uncharacterized protein n=1 Tax=Rhodococcus tukisamuensis TaxID=168276 RepID=A0A1G6S933_9NOCA|nr:hypothetical protein SAMN05444580_10350 [Rhodococcus tukisamuensis]
MTDIDPPRLKAPGPLAPATSGLLTRRNRAVKAATFAGLTPKGLMTDELIDFHRRPAAGRVGMTTHDMCMCAIYGGTHCVLDPKPANHPVPA